MSVGTSSVVPDARVRTAARATAVAFVGSGFAFASWASRIPQVRTHLQFTSAQLGLVLLAIAAVKRAFASARANRSRVFVEVSRRPQQLTATQSTTVGMLA